MAKAEISYRRAPSGELCAFFEQGKFLSPLLDLRRKKWEIFGLGYDIHFRPKDCVHVYCGLTKVIEIQRLHRNGVLKLKADRYYMEQECGKGFFREWYSDDSAFKEKLYTYLKCVKIDSRYIKKEGMIQHVWSQVTEPWMPFDREVRLAYQSREHQKAVRNFDGVEGAYLELDQNWKDHQNERGRNKWAKPKKMATKLDQLAMDPDGRLVLIELKDAKNGNPSEIYYSSFQLLQYIWEWRGALSDTPALLSQIQELLDARAEIGLVERPKSRLTGDIRAAVCFGTDGRSDEVKRRYGIVLDIVNRHLPPGVEPIETWNFVPGRLPEA